MLAAVWSESEQLLCVAATRRIRCFLLLYVRLHMFIFSFCWSFPGYSERDSPQSSRGCSRPLVWRGRLSLLQPSIKRRSLDAKLNSVNVKAAYFPIIPKWDRKLCRVIFYFYQDFSWKFLLSWSKKLERLTKQCYMAQH